MTDVTTRLTLQKDLARHLRAGHPWVFRKAIERGPRGLPAGAIVDVVEGERFVARGYYDPLSAIAVRVLTRDPAEAIDATFWKRRVQRALALRRELITGTTGYRLLHGESDGLPGVVADRDEIPHDEEDEEAKPLGRVLWGAEPPERISIDEHGMRLLVDVRRGQKTG